ncbi:uncharacterized protein TM35_000141090 [Trypanosoma theileri]|uniref:Uncharacterized protein n=1 Tax=Trypanosoma theileri TaxID=67003 RepID=A0A1X0NWH7_9TRYP|nr:uncharacterized protein TM35_000141090 [Trypanosoma theileri]ORC88898.1 hypothetical protein TM35_000141090 [Trypanosoma theileri]
MVAKCEVHISGVTFSYLVSSLLGSNPTVKHQYSLFGNCDIREDDSDEAESTKIIEVVLTTVLPAGVPAPKGPAFLGYASARRCGPHKLSYDDTKFLLEGTSQLDITHEDGPFRCPCFLLLLTISSGISSVNGTIKVEYSIFQGVGSEYSNLTNKNAIPLVIDNMVDSLSGFVRLASLGSHGSRPKSNSFSLRNSPQTVGETFRCSLAELERASNKEYELLQRIMNLEKKLQKETNFH